MNLVGCRKKITNILLICSFPSNKRQTKFVVWKYFWGIEISDFPRTSFKKTCEFNKITPQSYYIGFYPRFMCPNQIIFDLKLCLYRKMKKNKFKKIVNTRICIIQETGEMSAPFLVLSIFSLMKDLVSIILFILKRTIIITTFEKRSRYLICVRSLVYAGDCYAIK